MCVKLDCTLPPLSLLFSTPYILSISYIKGGLEFVKNCVIELTKVGILNYAVCDALQASSNNDPPDTFSNMNDNGGDFDKWARSKEYRGYIHIPSFNVSCDANGHLNSFNPHDPDYRDQSNPTKNPDRVV